MVSHESFSDSKSPQVSRTPLSILDDLNNCVIWMVSTRPLISMSSSPFANLLVIAPSTPITIGMAVTFMVHNFFSVLRGARGVMVIVVGNGHGNRSSNPGRD